MNIGAMIKKHRNRMDLTQEQLSEYLNVSVSAVSQWESGKTVPDVSTLPALANFFDITMDELFGRASADKERDIAEYDRLSGEYSNRGDVAKNLALWRAAAEKYPGDFHCLTCLAHSLLATAYCGGFEEEIEANAKECVAVCERILRDSRDSINREAAIQCLVHCYSNKNLSFANEEKAVEYAMMASGIYACREVLLESAYFTDCSREQKKTRRQMNMLHYMDLLTEGLYYGEFDSSDECISACNAALTLWKTLIYDGNYLFYHCRLQKVYIQLAINFGKQGKRAKTLAALKNALCHAKCFDELPDCEQHYTSVFVKSASSDASKSSKNYTFSNTEGVKRCMKMKVFDFLRGDEEFVKLGE